MYSGGQLGWSFSIGDIWDGIRRGVQHVLGGDSSSPNTVVPGGALTPGYHPTQLPFPVNGIVTSGMTTADIDNLATIADWASSVVDGGGVPIRERIPMLHPGDLAASYPNTFQVAPDSVKQADAATRARYSAQIDTLLDIHTYTAQPSNVGTLGSVLSGTADSGTLMKWVAIGVSALVLLPALMHRNPPSRARRRRRRRS